MSWRWFLESARFEGLGQASKMLSMLVLDVDAVPCCVTRITKHDTTSRCFHHRSGEKPSVPRCAIWSTRGARDGDCACGSSARPERQHGGFRTGLVPAAKNSEKTRSEQRLTRFRGPSNTAPLSTNERRLLRPHGRFDWPPLTCMIQARAGQPGLLSAKRGTSDQGIPNNETLTLFWQP